MSKLSMLHALHRKLSTNLIPDWFPGSILQKLLGATENILYFAALSSQAISAAHSGNKQAFPHVLWGSGQKGGNFLPSLIRHDSKWLRWYFSVLGILLLLFCLAACSNDPLPCVLDSSPEDTGVLKVVTRQGSTTYYLDRHEDPTGPEYDLAMEFASSKGWEVEWIVMPTTKKVLNVLEAGQAHLAASGLTHLESRNQRFERGPAHTEITEQVVCHRDSPAKPRKPKDLTQVEINVTADSSYAQNLAKLSTEYPELDFAEKEISTEVLLGRVDQQQLQCTVADSNIVQVNRRIMPALEVTMDLSGEQNLGWYLPRGLEDLARQAFSWMNSREGDEAISEMEYKYYEYIGEFDFVDMRALQRHLQERLPKFKDKFLLAEEETGLPADLLAAVAYQESHWDPQAQSFTGVRGLMMLTQRTAERVGVTDRLDPEQSILGGARYLAERHELLPEHIPEPDRTFLALASYNVGRGHLLDARQLARDLGKDPDSWSDMREVLPLLADSRYYPRLRYGYARGYEPVHFVQRIRNYQDVISQEF